MNAERLFSLHDKVAIVTGGTGVLGGAIARGLAAAGARVGVLGRRAQQALTLASAMKADGGAALPLVADVLDRAQLEAARGTIVDAWGGIDILVNAAGGNQADAIVVGDVTFFNLAQEALDQVVRLNLDGTILPTQVFGEAMVQRGAGSIINISSMAAQKPLTRVMGYMAASEQERDRDLDYKDEQIGRHETPQATQGRGLDRRCQGDVACLSS